MGTEDVNMPEEAIEETPPKEVDYSGGTHIRKTPGGKDHTTLIVDTDRALRVEKAIRDAQGTSGGNESSESTS